MDHKNSKECLIGGQKIVSRIEMSLRIFTNNPMQLHKSFYNIQQSFPQVAS